MVPKEVSSTAPKAKVLSMRGTLHTFHKDERTKRDQTYVLRTIDLSRLCLPTPRVTTRIHHGSNNIRTRYGTLRTPEASLSQVHGGVSITLSMISLSTIFLLRTTFFTDSLSPQTGYPR
jgi:hypothetical protein